MQKQTFRSLAARRPLRLALADRIMRSRTILAPMYPGFRQHQYAFSIVSKAKLTTEPQD